MDGVSRDIRRTMNRNIIVETFDAFMKAHNFVKSSGTWSRNSDDVITVVELQKSQYSARYYVNLALWLKPLGQNSNPKEQNCQIRTRLETVLDEEVGSISTLFDLDAAIPEAQRFSRLDSLLAESLLPILTIVSSLDQLRTTSGTKILKNCLVNRQAQEYLQQS